MNRFLSIILTLAWALWLGGMVVLVIFVTRLFQTSRDVAIQAAPVLFRSFAIYQLIVGMFACATSVIISLRTRRKFHAILSMLLVIALAAALMVHNWTFRMEDLRAAGQMGSEEFRTLHDRSTLGYKIELILLLIAGVGWTLTLSTRRKAEEIAAA